MTSSFSRGHRRAVGALAAVATVVPLLVATPALAADPVPAAAPTDAPTEDLGSRFTLAVLPDTQFYSRYSASQFYPKYGTDPFEVQTNWLVEQQDALNIPFVIHVGDVVDQESQVPEWDAAERAMNVLEAGGLDYSILPGNHDVSNQGARSSEGIAPRYLSRFSHAQVSGQPSFVSSFQNGLSTAYVFEAEGQKFMSMALAWNADPSTYAWAQSVLDAHPAVPVILSSHALLNIAGDQETPADWWFGEEVWNELIRKNDQIFLTFNGHFHGATSRTRVNDAGNEVLQVLTDYQMAADGGNGYLTLVEFDLERGALDVETVSPWITRKAPDAIARDDTPVLDGRWQSFTKTIDFAERFKGFAPEFTAGAGEFGDLSERAREIVSEGWNGSPIEDTALPGSREDYAKVDGTLAHWRFGDLDAGTFDSTMAVTDVAGDNDLHRLDPAQTDAADQLEDVSITRDDVAPFSSDAAASCFDNSSRSANRLSFLSTGFGSDLTRADLVNGYTIESFVKLDEAWSDDNRWTGWLSRAGKRSAMGMTWGGDMEAAPAFFSVSNLREFQWGISPSNGTAPVSLWSGEIMADQWHHVAVVNDPEANTTIMYVDGVPVLRNAADKNGMRFQDGQPWILGSWWNNDEPSNGWHGCIGETRVVDRPLAVTQFLTERADLDADGASFRVIDAPSGELAHGTEITELSGVGTAGAEVIVSATTGEAAAVTATAPVGADGRWTVAFDAPLTASGAWELEFAQRLGTRTGASLETTFEIAGPPPVIVTPEAVSFADAEGTSSDTFTVPAVGGIEYTVDGEIVTAGVHPGVGQVTVVARALEGFVLADGAQTEWSFSFTDVTAPVAVAPVPVRFTDNAGTSADTYTIPTQTGVQYVVGGEVVAAGTYPGAGTVTVTARALDGFTFAEGAASEWTFSFTDVPGDEGEPVPSTDPTAPAADTLVDANRGSLRLPETVTAGTTVVGTVDAAHAGAEVWSWIYSTPRALGTATVNALGELRLAIPADTTPGTHRIAVVLADGTLVGWDDIEVREASPLPATGGTIVGVGLALTLLIAGAAVFLLRRRRRALA